MGNQSLRLAFGEPPPFAQGRLPLWERIIRKSENLSESTNEAFADVITQLRLLMQIFILQFNTIGD